MIFVKTDTEIVWSRDAFCQFARNGFSLSQPEGKSRPGKMPAKNSMAT